MKKVTVYILILMFVLVPMMSFAGGQGEEAETEESAMPAEEEWRNPETLTFSMVPAEAVSQEVKMYEEMISYLEDVTGKEVDFFMPTNRASVTEAQVNGFVDIAVHGPYSYIMAHDLDPNIVVFATYAKKKGFLQEEGPGYKSVLITRKDSGFNDVASLKGKILGLADPASTSGNLVPRVVFARDELGGAELEDYFSKTVYTGGHDLTTMAVRDGKVDAGFVATHRFDNVIELGKANFDDFQVIYESPFIPQDPFTYDARLDPELRTKIEEAFLTLNESPKGKAFLDNVNSSRFVKMTDADYDVIRDLQKAKEEQEE